MDAFQIHSRKTRITRAWAFGSPNNLTQNSNIWDLFWTNPVQIRQCRMKVAGAIRSLVSFKGLQLECAMVLHQSLLVPFLMYGSEIMV